MPPQVPSKRDAKRTRIMEAARRCFRSNGIRATTMQEIAREAGIAVGTIYQFFPAKDDLILAWIEEYRSQHQSELREIRASGDPADVRLKRYLLCRFEAASRVRDGIPFAGEIARTVLRLVPNRVEEETQWFIEATTEMLLDGKAHGHFPSLNLAKDYPVFCYAITSFFPVVPDQYSHKPDVMALESVVDWFLDKWREQPPKRTGGIRVRSANSSAKKGRQGRGKTGRGARSRK